MLKLMLSRTNVFLIALSFIISASVHAEIYKCVNNSGDVNFSDSTCPNKTNQDIRESEFSDDPFYLLISGNYAVLEALYSTWQRDYETGTIDEDKLYDAFSMLGDNRESSEKYFTKWVLVYPESYAALTARGKYYLRVAKHVRRGRSFDEMPLSQLQKINKYLDKAESDLAASRVLTEKPLMSLMSLLNVNWERPSQSVEERRKLLDAALSIDPNAWLIRYRYMFSIEPRWGGSYDMMQSFLKESAEQSVSEEHLAILEVAIYISKMQTEARQKVRDDAFEKVRATIEKSKKNGWKLDDYALDKFAREALDRESYGDASVALDFLARNHYDEMWVYTNFAWIYMKKGGSYESRQTFLTEYSAQGVTDEQLAIMQSEICAYQFNKEKDSHRKNKVFDQLKSVYDITKSKGWQFSDNAVKIYANEMLEKKLYDEALVALNILAEDEDAEPWIYSNLGWIYIKKNQMPEAWKNVNIAAKMGDAWSQFSVGKTLYLGCPDIHLAADKRAGLVWMQKSAAQGFDEAKQFLNSNPS